MIDIRNVYKNYGKIQAVKNLSFVIGRGEIYGLLGPNGAGKSTTIRMIMNIIEPDSGKILIDRSDKPGMNSDRIGYMPEERGLYKKVKIEELLIYLAKLKGCPADRAKRQIGPYLERFGLKDWRYSMTDDLSKGMSQKVQFISTILHDPDIIILDEPFSGLDPVSADQMSEVISELRNKGKTIIFSTHVMVHAEQICNKICILKNGEIKTSGNLSEVKSRHGRNTVVMDFEGDPGFIKELPFVSKLLLWPGTCEVSLKDDNGSEQKLLKAAAEQLKISRFEVQRPSLHKIFVDLAGNPEGDDE